jgi:RNA polymerase primary sigma factor
MALCVRDAGMPRKDFIASFPKNETNLHWVDKHIRQNQKRADHSRQIPATESPTLNLARRMLGEVQIITDSDERSTADLFNFSSYLRKNDK